MQIRALVLNIIIILSGAILLSCGRSTTEQYNKEFDLAGIKKRGELVVLTDYNSISFV